MFQEAEWEWLRPKPVGAGLLEGEQLDAADEEADAEDAPFELGGAWGLTDGRRKSEDEDEDFEEEEIDDEDEEFEEEEELDDEEFDDDEFEEDELDEEDGEEDVPEEEEEDV